MIFNSFLVIKVLLLIYVTSAEFNLNLSNTTNKSLDTFNQTKITLNNTWHYKDAKDDPIKGSEIKQQQQQRQQQQIAKGNGKLLFLLNTTATTNNSTKFLTTNQKPLNNENKVKQLEPKHHQHNRNSNSKHLHQHYNTTKLKFNKRNNENNHDNFNLNHKLKTITEDERKNDAKETKQNAHNKASGDDPAGKKEDNMQENNGNLNEKYQTKYYVPTNSLSNGWLGQLPQLQLQPQQLQLFLQQTQLQQEQSTSSMPAAASLLPQEYHHLSDYRFLFYAERHTIFYLHTLNQQEYVAVATKAAAATTPTLASFKQDVAHNIYDDNDDYYYNYYDDNANEYNNTDDDESEMEMETMVNLTNPRVLNVVTDTIGAVFGVNTRPLAGIQGIQIEEVELYNGLSLRQSRFNPFNPCRILIHGWLGGSHAGIYNTLVPEYFKLQQGKYNIITVDWGKGAIADYITASYRVKPVGMVVAKFIDFLHQESGITFDNIHVIGFSMGAHIAGIAGKHVQTGRLPVIYGLDPALPFFRYENVHERLDIRDAKYVEVVHTSAGSYGYDHPLGHVDFYVNYGYNQPGCFFNECSHLRAFQVFGQSLANELLQGVRCSANLWLDLIKHKRCLKSIGTSLKMSVEGMRVTEVAVRRGLYYVITNAQSPYKVGQKADNKIDGQYAVH